MEAAVRIATELGQSPVHPGTDRLAHDLAQAPFDLPVIDAAIVESSANDLRGLSPLWTVSPHGLLGSAVSAMDSILNQIGWADIGSCAFREEIAAVVERHLGVFARYCVRLAGSEAKAKLMLSWPVGSLWALRMWNDAMAGKVGRYSPWRLAECERDWIKRGAIDHD